MDNTSIWTGELGQQTVTETYLHNQQNIQRLDLTNPETYNETQTKEEKEEPQTQYEEQLSRYQELTLIGVNSIIQTNKDDHKIANNRIIKEITKRYKAPGTNQNLGIHDISYLTSQDHVLLTSFPKLCAIYSLVIRACSQFKKGPLLLQTKSKGTTITSSIAQEAYKGEYTHINVSTEQQTNTFKPTQTNWITPANATIPRKGRKTSFITEQSYFFLAKNKKKQRMILTEDLNYRDHALTKDIVRKISRMYNLLHMIKNS